MVPVFGRSRAAADRGEAVIGGTQILLGLQTFRAKFGRYPSKLSELEDTLKWQAPQDPFSGKAFVYKLRPGGFLLYSIGEDLKDNGGLDTTHGSSGKRSGDMVFRMPEPR